MSTIEDARQALEAELTGALAIKSADIAWKGKTFNTTTRTTRWYRVTFLPGVPVPAGIGSNADNYCVFLFQVDIFDPANNGENITAIEAQRIAYHFNRGTSFTRNGQIVTCEKSYRQTTDDSDPKWVKIAVIVQGWAEVPN